VTLISPLQIWCHTYSQTDRFHEIEAIFTSHANPKYFLFHPLYQIFGYIYGVLNIGKKISLSGFYETNLLSLVTS
jgi:hypothetical protein